MKEGENDKKEVDRREMRRLLPSMAALLATNTASDIVPAFIPKFCHVDLPRSSVLPEQCRMIVSSGTSTSSSSMRMNYKSPDEKNSYNDDAFGLVFLIGAVLSQDIDFVATFASLSAIAAISTNSGLVGKDERAPAAVAILTLLISPVTSSFRRYGSLEQLASPVPVEIGLCLISTIWAFVNWSRTK